MTTQSPAGELSPHAILQPMTLRWILKRTALAVAILVVTIGSMAWLTYASIDPLLDDAAQSLDAVPAADVPVTKVKLSL